jgi:uncharacterized protein
MNVIAKLIVLLALVPFLFPNPDLTGEWKGALNVQGTHLNLVVRLEWKNEHYAATLDSPDQNVSGIPVSEFTVNDSTVKFKVPSIGGLYEGIYCGDTITGAWKQSGQSFLLVLVRKTISK